MLEAAPGVSSMRCVGHPADGGQLELFVSNRSEDGSFHSAQFSCLSGVT